MHVNDLLLLPEADRAVALQKLPPDKAAALRYYWPFWARPEQLPPLKLASGEPWSYWLILAGRGFGKTRTGAEWVKVQVRTSQYVNIIGATADDVRDIMVEGESGILAVCHPDERPVYRKHESKLVWPNGAETLCFTAAEPDRLRGKQHARIWADELAAWKYPEAWDQAKFGLRLGDHPQAVATTTPRPTKLIVELMHDPKCYVTRGSTYDNKANLAAGFFSDIITKYEGTRLGRQELNAEVLMDTPGALWRPSQIDEQRIAPEHLPELQRIVVAVDPAISSEENSDETGIIVCGVAAPDADGRRHGYILEDCSGRYNPDEWSRQTVAAYRKWDADCVVAEKNQGGAMVEHTIRSAADEYLPIKLVHASRGKVTRAEPVSALYEQGLVHHVGLFHTLEDQMSSFTSDFDRKLQGYSPDRVDALVWGMTELHNKVSRKVTHNRVDYDPKPREF